jgi:hypothetical protein
MRTYARSNGALNGQQGRQQGQVLVLVVLGLALMLGVVALVIDGGYAFAQQRGSQNGADASATAGALIIAQNLPFRAVNQAPPKTDADVAAAINGASTNNSLASVTAYYTNITGALIRVDGTVTANIADASQVGGGTLPATAWGVRTYAVKSFETFFARIPPLNLTTITATTEATAVAGFAQDLGAGNVLPVTIPLNIIYCANNGDFQTQQPPVVWPLGQEFVIPLCKGNASGNVGWLDWYPPAGGTSELIDTILHPNNPNIPTPSWQYVTSTGNLNAGGVEDALNTYAGKVVLIPFFDNACDAPNTAGNSACPPGSGPGTGQNNWYHVPYFFGFKMDYPKAAYLQGSNPECGSLWSGAGCLKGTLVSYVGPGVTVGAGTGTSLDAYSAVGVQLIK